jgi:hypothetical protein
MRLRALRATEEAATAYAAAVPAVAGFLHREIAPVDHRLASRLAAVATLNTPAGRKPRTAPRRERTVKPVPAAAKGGKPQRAPAGPGRRVPSRATPAQTASTALAEAVIIPFRITADEFYLAEPAMALAA